MLFKYFYGFVFIFTLAMLNKVIAQKVIPLYKEKIPNSKNVIDEEISEYGADSILRISKIARPALTVYLAPDEKATGTAVIICPGGGYWFVSFGHEGVDVAKRFNEMGISAFVLKYRLPDENTMINKEIGPFQDAQKAIQLVRKNFRKWRINTNRIGIMGFSAGGHLASTAGTRFNESYIINNKQISLRPDFMILAYPVISFADSIAHIGSRDQLLGKEPTAEKIEEYSNELQVSLQTPPTFLVHAKDDDAVSVKNTLNFAQSLKKNNVPVEMYLYEKGGHGFGMNNPTSQIKWMDIVEQWLNKMKFIGNDSR